MIALLLAATLAQAAPDLRDTLFLVSMRGSAGLGLHPDRPDEARSWTPSIGGSLGVRFNADYEIHMAIEQKFLGQPSAGGLLLLGTAFNYSPRSFYGGFAQGRLGWIGGTAFDALDTSRLYVGGAAGYSWVPAPPVDLRALAAVELLPTRTTLGNQNWISPSIELQAVFKSDTIQGFILNLLGNPGSR